MAKKYDVLIQGGTVILPDSKGEQVLNVAIVDGSIERLCFDEPEAEYVIDAKGLYVSPGFIDSHMHDEEVGDGDTVEQSLLRQGVTTAIAGNCGSGLLAKDIIPFRQHPWLNLGFLTGHTKLREAAGATDTYAPATPEQIAKMKKLLRAELEGGTFGISFGLEYLPKTSTDEIEALLEVAKDFKQIWVPVHIRSDGPEAVEATDEILDLARKYKPMRFQISHTASMTAFGRLAEVLEHIEKARTEGADVTFDCYPYDAFCTTLGSAVFDPGFEKRWGKGLESLEIGSGPYRGRWLNEDNLYDKLRAEEPECLIIAHVIRTDEMELCIAHPDCAIASDSILQKKHGHPRAAGTFPRALRMLRNKGFSWPEAIRKCTSLPADMTWLNKGRIKESADADIVIFDGDRLKDRATFAEQLLPPEGIKWVIIGGIPAVRNNEILGEPKGRLINRNN